MTIGMILISAMILTIATFVGLIVYLLFFYENEQCDDDVDEEASKNPTQEKNEKHD